ncbi:hypothetical protein HPB52_012264 [Rhipicephalus sanguineus]|uniref:Uncharacterized protein n=1 Tax=Rhipicephalus sanguineus TaxID=34632 RepID=A0A9D4SWL7_RHISA|nr:hypothetical protein HPB52_012264 [Rhipicephalus sanguineus]
MGPEKNTSPTELLDNIYTPDAEILHARIMGSTNTALITFVGLEVLRYVWITGRAEAAAKEQGLLAD